MFGKFTLAFALFISFSLAVVISQPPDSQQLTQSREHFNAGVKYGIDLRFEEAIAAFEKAIDINPLYAEAFLYKALAEIELGNYTQANRDLTITIELDPSFSDQAHYFRGLSKYFQQQYRKAIDDLTIAIRLNPDFVAFYQRGKANLELKEYSRSLQDFDIALRLKEDFHEGYLYRGINLYYLEKYEEAMHDLDLAKNFLADNPKAYYYSALVRLELQNSYVAIEDLDRAIELQPEFAMAYEARARARQNTGNQAAADSDKQQAQSIRIENPDANIIKDTGSQTSQAMRKASTDLNFENLFQGSEQDYTHNSGSQVTNDEQPIKPDTAGDKAIEQDEAPVAATAGDTRENKLLAEPDDMAEITEDIDIDMIASGTYSRDLMQQNVKGFGVQVASYSNTANLLNLADAYAEKYNKPVFINVALLNDRKLYKLIIGNFSSRSEAEGFRDHLRSDDFPDSFLIVFDNL